MRHDPPADVKAPGPRGYNLRSIDEAFDRKVVTTGGMTVLAPRNDGRARPEVPAAERLRRDVPRERLALLQGS
jgi:hypothetical protein